MDIGLFDSNTSFGEGAWYDQAAIMGSNPDQVGLNTDKITI